MPTIPELLRDHVSPEIECVDRVYLNGYVPTLQTSGALVYFLQHHKRQRKDDLAAQYRRQFTGSDGVVLIGVAQEQLSGFMARKEVNGKQVWFQYSRQPVFVKVYYFYIQDAEFGPGFVKVGTYAPYPVKVCLNGHEVSATRARSGPSFFRRVGGAFAVAAVCRRSSSRLSASPVHLANGSQSYPRVYSPAARA